MKKNCSFNPSNKVCSSCDNLDFMDYSTSTCCKIHDISYFLEVEEGFKTCNDWTNQKERIKKILSIKSKIVSK